MSSPLSTPGSRNPHDGAGYRFEENSTACEWGEGYRPGGYHPVHLGDTFRNRYRVIRKIGYGEYSTVWLAVDLQLNRYVALKISIASFDQAATDQEISLYQRLAKAGAQHIGSQYLVCLQDFFEHHGPNGCHACFVFEPMGPNLDTMLLLLNRIIPAGRGWQPRFPTQFAKRALREVLLGLQFLHANGVVHGDLHVGNILVNIRPVELDDTSLQRLEQSPSQGRPLRRLDGKVDRWAPLYLLEPTTLLDFTSLEPDPQVKVTDLGAAFPENHPPVTVVTPGWLRAPELILGLPFGKGIDIWSFGCLMFLLLTGRQLFQSVDLDGDEYDALFNDEHLLQLSEILRPLPETMFTKWHRRDEYFDSDGRRITTWDTTERKYGDNSDSKGAEYGDNSDGEGAEYGGNLNGKGAESDDRDAQISIHSVPLSTMKPCESLERQFSDEKPEDIGEAEEKMILHLIDMILQHDPLRRPSASEILEHPWFRFHIPPAPALSGMDSWRVDSRLLDPDDSESES